MAVAAVVFDFDGTLTRPGRIDFAAIRAAVGCPAGTPVLDFLDGMTDADERRAATAVLARFEMAAAAAATPNPGAERLVAQLREWGLPAAILTRNSRQALRRSLANFADTCESDFDLILTRDDGIRPKPNPQGVRLAAAEFGVAVADVLVVGDYVFDIEAGHNAGAQTGWITNGVLPASLPRPPTLTVADLEELNAWLRLHRRLPCGKLPNDILAEILRRWPAAGDDVLLPPGIGRDCAVVDSAGRHLLALKSDPITFATEALGTYAVLVNANDVAAAGAVPRWFLTTLLLPPGCCAADVMGLISDLHAAAAANGIALCGGHTEITDAVTRAVVSGQMVGVFPPDRPVCGVSVEAGDEVVLTKGVAVEGTAVLARELGDGLLRLGVDKAVVARARDFLFDPGISVLTEARAALTTGWVRTMHDVTEGGLATAMWEFSVAAGRGIDVWLERIHRYPETEQICAALGLNPLGLIGSGSLLLACVGGQGTALAAALRQAGVAAASVGRFVEAPAGVTARDAAGASAVWPSFAVDEVARAVTTG